MRVRSPIKPETLFICPFLKPLCPSIVAEAIEDTFPFVKQQLDGSMFREMCERWAGRPRFFFEYFLIQCLEFFRGNSFPSIDDFIQQQQERKSFQNSISTGCEYIDQGIQQLDNDSILQLFLSVLFKGRDDSVYLEAEKDIISLVDAGVAYITGIHEALCIGIREQIMDNAFRKHFWTKVKPKQNFFGAIVQPKDMLLNTWIRSKNSGYEMEDLIAYVLLRDAHACLSVGEMSLFRNMARKFPFLKNFRITAKWAKVETEDSELIRVLKGVDDLVLFPKDQSSGPDIICLAHRIDGNSEQSSQIIIAIQVKDRKNVSGGVGICTAKGPIWSMFTDTRSAMLRKDFENDERRVVGLAICSGQFTSEMADEKAHHIFYTQDLQKILRA